MAISSWRLPVRAPRCSGVTNLGARWSGSSTTSLAACSIPLSAYAVPTRNGGISVLSSKKPSRNGKSEPGATLRSESAPSKQRSSGSWHETGCRQWLRITAQPTTSARSLPH